MSNTTWHRVEDAAGVRDTTYSRVDEVLDWPPGTCREVLDDPSYKPFPTETAKGARYSRVQSDEGEFMQALQTGVIATLPNVTGAEIMALQKKVQEELRRLRGDG